VSGLVVVGASYAGVQTAIIAREGGYGDPIRIVGEEPSPPYQRPPLSKEFLLGQTSNDSLILRDGEYFQRKGIELLLGVRAMNIDLHTRHSEISDGARLGFDKLVLATGSRPRPLTVPGAERPGLDYLRTLSDAEALKGELMRAAEIIIIGGGFIDLEVAASAGQQGKRITIIEAAPRLLGRAVSPVVSAFLLSRHRSYGVDLRLAETVESIVRERNGQWIVSCRNGGNLQADLILAGIGGIPNVELAAGAGLNCDNGIVVDVYGRTSDSDIFAAGDCANQPIPFVDKRTRLESVQAAQDQGKIVGSVIAANAAPSPSVPRFWSDQYDLKLQIVGITEGRDQQAIRGEPCHGSFSVFSYRRGRLIAVESVNRPGEQLITRRLIGASISPSPMQVADLSFDLKAMTAEPA
jgi:3-phenylpropionate/trans-cinnamate dioxygenase ferredoxin reductase subunit